MLMTRDKLVEPDRQRRDPTLARVRTSGVSYNDLSRICLEAVRQWPGCESVAGIQIIRGDRQKFSVRVTLYGKAEKRVADRAIKCVEREMCRHFHLME